MFFMKKSPSRKIRPLPASDEQDQKTKGSNHQASSLIQHIQYCAVDLDRRFRTVEIMVILKFIELDISVGLAICCKILGDASDATQRDVLRYSMHQHYMRMVQFVKDTEGGTPPVRVIARMRTRSSSLGKILTGCPFNAEQAQRPRRHQIPKIKFRIENWAAYDAGPRHRSRLTSWLTPEVMDV
jgi:hypothetical protein